MSELRLILLVIGVLIIAGVFFFSRRPRYGKEDDDSKGAVPERTEPVIPSSLDGLENPPGSQEPKVTDSSRNSGVLKSGQKIVVLNILPQTGAAFDGRHVLEAFTQEGLEFGAYDIFHYASKLKAGTNLFSVANIMEPGSFDLEKLPEQNISGLTLFTVLPVKNLESVHVFAEMLAISRRLAEDLGGEVTDESRSTLTRQTAHHLRESIVEFDAQLGRSS